MRFMTDYMIGRRPIRVARTVIKLGTRAERRPSITALSRLVMLLTRYSAFHRS